MESEEHDEILESSDVSNEDDSISCDDISLKS